MPLSVPTGGLGALSAALWSVSPALVVSGWGGVRLDLLLNWGHLEGWAQALVKGLMEGARAAPQCRPLPQLGSVEAGPLAH